MGMVVISAMEAPVPAENILMKVSMYRDFGGSTAITFGCCLTSIIQKVVVEVVVVSVVDNVALVVV